MQLVPVTSIISKRKTSLLMPTSAVAAGTFAWEDDEYNIVLTNKAILPAKEAVSGQIEHKKAAACIVPYWFVRSTEDEAEANCKIDIKDITIAATQSSKPLGRHQLSIPCIVNCKKVEKSSELVVFDQDPGTTRKRLKKSGSR